MSNPLMTLGQVAQWLAQSGDAASQPQAMHGDANTPMARVHTDTRTIAPGDLFVVSVEDKDGRRWLLASFHGDSNGLSTRPVVSIIIFLPV